MNKKMPKKLALCTETLRNLDAKDLQHAAGATVAASNCSACDCTPRQIHAADRSAARFLPALTPAARSRPRSWG